MYLKLISQIIICFERIIFIKQQKMIQRQQSYKHYIKQSQLNSLKMLDESFSDFNNESLRTYVRTIFHLQFTKELKQSLNLVAGKISIKKPRQIIKIIVFLNIVLQQTLTKDKIVMATINKLLSLVKDQNKHPEKNRSSTCLGNTFSWFKNQFTQIQKHKKIIKSSSSHSLNFNEETESVENKEEYFVHKIIKPYLAYLIKYMSIFPMIEKCYKGQKLQIYEIWSIFNILSYLFGVSRHFDRICRYYGAQFRRAIECIVSVFVRQIRILYGIMKTTVEYQRSKIKRGYNKYKNIEDKSVMMKILIQNYPIDEMYKIIEEIEKINEQIESLFGSRYFQSRNKEVLSILIRVQTPHYDFIQKIYKYGHKFVGKQSQCKNKKQQTFLLTTIPTLQDDQNKTSHLQKIYQKDNKFKNIRKRIIEPAKLKI